MKTVMESVFATNQLALLVSLKALSERGVPRYSTSPGSPRQSNMWFRCGLKGHFVRECRQSPDPSARSPGSPKLEGLNR